MPETTAAPTYECWSCHTNDPLSHGTLCPRALMEGEAEAIFQAWKTLDDAEMWCARCGVRHGVVWFAPNDLWNEVMREGDRGKPDEFGFCCPLCFMQLAGDRLGPLIFEVRRG